MLHTHHRKTAVRDTRSQQNLTRHFMCNCTDRDILPSRQFLTTRNFCFQWTFVLFLFQRTSTGSSTGSFTTNGTRTQTGVSGNWDPDDDEEEEAHGHQREPLHSSTPAKQVRESAPSDKREFQQERVVNTRNVASP